MITLHTGVEQASRLLLFDALRHEGLASDLRGIVNGTAPTKDILQAAPMVDQWLLAERPVPGIVGMVAGHPLLRSGPVLTSDVVAIDLIAGWARTLSRFYVLGQPAGGARV